jgi:hypothetical protein
MSWARWALVTAALAGCGSDSATAPPASGNNTVSGTIQGVKWTKAPSAYWIGTPTPPSAFLFLFENPTACSSITNVNWDKIIGNEQVLEIELHEMAAKAFRVPMDAGVAYLRGNYNPSAEAGTVTIGNVVPGKSVTGTFDATFVGEALKGTFEASYCAAGVEP